MSIWIEDTARNVLAAWAKDAKKAGLADAAVLSPFSTPYKQDWKQGGAKTVKRLRTDGLDAWFDPETHALQMPAVGAFRYYESWNLWSGEPGILNGEAAMRDHVKRVFAVQDELDVPHLAPTILLHSAQSVTSQQALELSRVAAEEDPNCWLSIAGDSMFWSAGTLLDGHIGALAQLEPKGWFVSVTRQSAVVPVPALPAEVYGMCRTVRALSEDAQVHVSHGDIAGLPAMAAGASSLGTGWDTRQKVSAYSSYMAPDPDADGGGWFGQVTHRGLVSCLVRGDASVLANRRGELSDRLVPGSLPPNKPKLSWNHHAAVINELCDSLDVSYREAYEQLVSLYERAQADWNAVARVLGVSSRADAWITPLLDGLLLYGQVEEY